MRVYPAYARTIARHLVRGQRPVAIGVLLSSRWWYFDQAAKICVSPDEWWPGRFEFGYLKNEHVVAIMGEEAPPKKFGELLIELMLAGPRLLWARDLHDWLLKDSTPDALQLYADDLTAREYHGLALLARDRYEDAQLRELGLVSREAARAAQLARADVPFVRQRAEAQQMAERLFSVHDPVDERAA